MKAYIVPVLAAALAAPAAAGQPVLTVSPAAAAQPHQASFSLSNAIERAQHHNGELQALAQEVAALQARSSQAGTFPNPSLDYLREGRHDEGGSTSFQVAIPIELGGKRGTRVDAAVAELRVATLDLAAGRMRVQAEVVAAFHEAYLAQKRLALASQASASARQSSHSASRRVLAGKVSPVEETRAKVAEASLQIEAIQAGRDLTEARLKLALLCGNEPTELPTLGEPNAALPSAANQHDIAARLAEAPLMQRAAADVDWRASVARMERAKRFPDVSVILGKRREGIGRERQTVLGLSVPLPLFDRNQGGILEAERRIDKSRAELAFAQQRVLAEALQAAARLDAALEQERVIRQEVLPGSQSAFEAASKGFDAGKFSFLEVLDAQRTYFHAQTQHLQVISDAHRAAADLATLIGPGKTFITTTRQQDAQ